MENFFGHLKSELLYNQTFYSLDQFIKELHEYMWYYNNERIKKRYSSKKKGSVHVALNSGFSGTLFAEYLEKTGIMQRYRDSNKEELRNLYNFAK